jgi:ectoine hydroxylase-related dioxygenase (phytanoyl-CoA dioxygenase family)
MLKQAFINFGFAMIDQVYSESEIDQLSHLISVADHSNKTFRKTDDLFAIRQFLKEISQATQIIFNEKLITLINSAFGNGYFVTKSIYFDKPPKSNWFVAYHQDLTISVKEKCDIAGYGQWTTKHNQFAVQPPTNILENNFTIRIHLDDTTKENGALKVVPGSHKKGIYRPESIDWNIEKEQVCEVKKGSIMIMHPLLLHSSGRSTSNKRRRVIHIEFSKEFLPGELRWAEYLRLDNILNER